MPSFTEAIEKKINSDRCVSSEPQDFGNIVIYASKKDDTIPVNLILNDCGIDCVGDLDKLIQLCDKVEELDLSHNNLTDWTEIYQILRNLPQLNFINLGFNNLSQLQFPCNLHLHLENLETLALIKTGVKWPSVWTLLPSFPNLKELHLSRNEYDDITPPSGDEQAFTTIEKLMFDGNLVSRWSQVQKLGRIFPSLKHLSSSNCPLKLDDNSELQENLGFLELQSLNLTSTRVSTDKEILWLNKLPNLKEVRLSGIPFLENIDRKEKRQELISLLPKITKLNGGAEITSDEREAAERFVIRKYLDADIKPSHYSDLVNKHGKLDPLLDLSLKPVTKIRLKIKFMEMEVEQQINLRQTVKDFKKFLEPIIGLPPARMQLYYLDVGLNFGRDVLRFPDRKLYSYQMHDGDEIHVEVRNNSSREIMGSQSANNP